MYTSYTIITQKLVKLNKKMLEIENEKIAILWKKLKNCSTNMHFKLVNIDKCIKSMWFMQKIW